MGKGIKKKPSGLKGIRKPNSAQKRVDLSPTVKKRLEDHSYTFMRFDKPRFTKKNYINIFEGFDFLQNLFAVKDYIKKQYGITQRDLEMILYLYPKNYFLKDEIVEVSNCYPVSNINILRRKRLVERYRTKPYDKIFLGKREFLYCLSSKSRIIVRDFYEYLSGSKKMTITKYRKLRYYEEGFSDQQNKILKENLVKKFASLIPSDSQKKAEL